jgi:hypothetical protein
MRMTAGPCADAPDFPDFRREIFFAYAKDTAPARKTALNLPCAEHFQG